MGPVAPESGFWSKRPPLVVKVPQNVLPETENMKLGDTKFATKRTMLRTRLSPSVTGKLHALTDSTEKYQQIPVLELINMLKSTTSAFLTKKLSQHRDRHRDQHRNLRREILKLG